MGARTSVAVLDRRAAAKREAAAILAKRQRDQVRRATLVADFTWETATHEGTTLVYGITPTGQRVALRLDPTDAAKLVDALTAGRLPRKAAGR